MIERKIQSIRVYGLLLLVILLCSAVIPAEEVVVKTATSEHVVVQTTGAAVSQFYSYSSTNTNACAGIVTTDSLVIKNQGTVADTYSITVQGDIASWIHPSASVVTLNPGQQQTITLYISAPYGTEDTYDYTIEVASVYDSTKYIEKTLSVSECPNINVKGYPSYQQSCPCSTAVYIFEVANTGAATETYTLYLEGLDQEYYDLSEYSLTLQPHETKQVYAYVRMACFVYGDYDFTLIAQTVNSQYTAELPLALKVQQACYNYNIVMGEALVFTENQPLELDFTPTYNTEYVVCQETPAVIPVQIQNPGEIMNEYNLKIEDAEDWISTAEPYVKLLGNQEKITSIVVNTAAADPDTYSFALKVDTLRGDLQTVIPFTVEVQDCTPDGLPTWLTYTLWTLLGIVILAILIAAFFLLRGSQSKTGKSNKVAEAIHKHKKLLYWLLPLLLLLLLVGIFAYPHIKDAQSAVSLGKMWNTVETAFYNWATALIILGILLLIALLLWYFKFRKKTSKNGKKTNAKKDRWKSYKEFYEKAKPYLKWLWIILLLLILLGALGAGGYYLYKNYQKDAEKYLHEHEQNLTEETNETIEVEVPVIDTTNTTTTIVEIRYDNETLAALQQQLDEVQKNMTDKDQRIATLEIELLKLAEQAAASSNTTDLEAYEQQIDDLQDRINALEEQLAALQEREAELLGALNATNAKVTLVDSHVSEIEDRIDALEEQIAALQDMIAQLSIEQVNETVINETQEELNDLNEEKENLENKDTEGAQSPDEIVVPVITDNSYETTLIFDVSLSGQIVENGMTRFQRGVEAAEKYIQPKGLYNVMIIGKNPIMVHRDTNRRDAMRIIHYLRPIDTQSNLGKSLYAAAKDLQGSKGRIVLISDMETTDNTDLSEVHDELEAQGYDVVFINIAFKETTPAPEENTAEEESEEQQSPYFDVETQTAESFQIDIPMNTDYTLDLNTYFSDADNDLLVYTAEADEHLVAMIKENLAVLTPEKDWTGKTTVIFSADDTKGGIVKSPALVVNVFSLEPESSVATEETQEQESEEEVVPAEETEELEEETTEQTEKQQEISLQSYIPGIIIGSIIVLIVGSLIIGAFIKKFQKQ